MVKYRNSDGGEEASAVPASVSLSHELGHSSSIEDAEEAEPQGIEEVIPADGSELQKNKLAEIPVTLKVEAAVRGAVRRMFIDAD